MEVNWNIFLLTLIELKLLVCFVSFLMVFSINIFHTKMSTNAKIILLATASLTCVKTTFQPEWPTVQQTK